MSKQDRQGVRTATDLERKLGYGESFARMYGLDEVMREVTNEAVEKLDKELNDEEIFNRLTNYGDTQGIYRENDKIYVNASYIKSGKLAAEYIDAANLKVSAANITGTLDANKVTINNLSASSITGGILNAGMVDIINLDASSITSGTLNAAYVDIINLNADNITSGTLCATALKGSYVDLLNASGAAAGDLNITGSSSSSHAVALTSYGALRLTANTGDIYASAYGNITLATDYVRLNNCMALTPSGVITSDLGSDGARFGTIYANTGEIDVSDRRLKNSIEDLPEKYIAMLAAIRPRRFKMYDSTSDRYHIGFISQEVEEAMTQAGISSQEFAGFVKGVDKDGEDIYMLRYSEFIGILLAAIQNHENRLSALEGVA